MQENFFQPMRRLADKSRRVGRVVRRHDEAMTPYQRMIDSGALAGARRVVLEKLYLLLNPLWLSRRIDEEIEKLEKLAWKRGDPLTWNTAGNRDFEATPLVR